MNVTQTVEVPPSHRLVIDVPPEVPAGPVILTFTPAKAVPAATVEEKAAAEPAGNTKSSTPHTDFLSGILAGAGDITREQIREERLRKYLQ